MHDTTFIAVLIVLLAVAVLVVPLAGEAQQAASLPRIGFLSTASLSDPFVARFLLAFRQGLRDLGYVEGQNIAIEFRWAEGQYDRLPGLAAELVRLKVNVIVAGSPPAIQAAKQATETIPIVMGAVADPVAMAFVASLPRPGGNITGLSMMHSDLVGKQLELLKEVLPKVSRVALLGNPANPNYASLVRHGQDAARALDIRGFNPWRHVTPARSTAPSRRSPRSGPAPSSFSRTGCSSITAHESPTTRSGAVCRRCSG